MREVCGWTGSRAEQCVGNRLAEVGAGMLDRVAKGRSSQPIAVIGFVNVLRAHPPAAPRKR